jgi:hypothetical protein
MDFEEMNSEWDRIDPGDFNKEASDLRDGEYIVKILGLNFKEIPGTGLAYIWKLEVCDGVCSGSYIEKFQVATKVGMKILAQDLVLLIGRKPELSEVYNETMGNTGSVGGELKGKTLRIRQVTKGKYKNFYFNELLSSPDRDTSSNGSGDEDDYMIPDKDFGEEIPF